MRSTRVACGLVVAACAAIMLPAAVLAQTSPFVGQWRMNMAMSKAPPGETPPKSVVTDIERVDPLHVRWTMTVVDAQGQTDKTTFDLPANGEFYPISDDTTAAIRLNGNSLQANFRSADGQTDQLNCTVSTDGRAMTCNGQMSQQNGGMASYVDVFDRS